VTDEEIAKRATEYRARIERNGRLAVRVLWVALIFTVLCLLYEGWCFGCRLYYGEQIAWAAWAMMFVTGGLAAIWYVVLLVPAAPKRRRDV
jgi:hypothetical protein